MSMMNSSETKDLNIQNSKTEGFILKDDSKTNDIKRQNISFKFTKSSSKKITGNKLSEDEILPKDSDSKDFVSSVEDKEFKGSKPKEEKKELVIPLIQKNTWRSSVSENKNDPVSKEKLINQLAIKELIAETSLENEKWENREFQNFSVAIPLVVQNKIPEGYETDTKMDVSLRPDPSTLEDYEKIPVESFGIAMLRGMGWKPGAGIGGKNQELVKPLEVVLRPKGLGLGADKSVLKDIEKKKVDEKLELLKGSYVHVIQGNHKGVYGQVEGLDDENARAIIRLNDDKCVTLPEFYLEVVSKKEFEKESKVINKRSYDEYVKSHEAKSKSHQKISTDRNPDDSHSRTRTNDSYIQESKGFDSRASLHHKKKKHSKERKRETKHSSSNGQSEEPKMWICSHLKVRMIDDKYKKGKYFKEKMVVEDVLSSKYCVCKTEDGKYLDDIQHSMLETVIPRSESAHVMIVKGKHRGQLGVILKKDKENCTAAVQFLSDRQKVAKLEYDCICEYVGDISQFD